MPTPTVSLPINFVRQYAGPLDIDSVFTSTAARLAYLTSPRRYAGMIVSDTEDGNGYMLNSAGDAWIAIAAGGASVNSVNGEVGDVILDTDDVDEGSVNLYYTNTRVASYIATVAGAANGLATLDGSGRLPIGQLPISAMEYKGIWNASTNFPTLADGVGSTGDLYRVGTAGTQDLGSGNITFALGDYVIYNGTTWEKADTTDSVNTVNGQSGTVVLDTDDVNEGATNLYYTDARVRAAIGGSSSIDFNTGTGVISAITNSVVQKIEVYKTGSLIGTRKAINLIEGTNVTLTVADDAGNDRVNITVAATGGGGSVGTLQQVTDLDNITTNEIILYVADPGVDTNVDSPALLL
jgi:hypothetical protein